MDTAQFLARAVAPGNYLAIAVDTKDGTKFAWKTRLYPHTVQGRRDAASYLAWCAADKKKNGDAKTPWDAYHAQASYTMAIAENDAYGHTYYKGSRKPDNLQALKSFWIDIDVKRAGDKKTGATSYPTQADAIQWLAGFRRTMGLPKISMLVSSGYGLHAYWILEDPVTLGVWEPYGAALRSALIAHGFRCDPGISSDAIRILRPPGTVNMKSGTPAPVTSLMSGPDVPNTLMFAALQPYVQLAAAKPAAQAAQGQAQVVGATSALSGGTVSPIFANAPNMAAAAQANMPISRRERSFALMAAPGGCEQIRLSLANHGNGDQYPLWYLGHLTAAYFTTDGHQFVHPISNGDPRYTAQATDAAVARIAAEMVAKKRGWPSCTHFERTRPATCLACPHRGRISSPLDLAVDSGDLPDGYRRAKGAIETWVETKDGGYWTKIILGDIYAPVLDENYFSGFTLLFKHEFSGSVHDIAIPADSLSTDTSAIFKLFQRQKMILHPGTELRVRAFILDYITLLRTKRAQRTENIHAFGWATDGPKTIGFAHAGTLYRADGSVEAAPGGDRVILSMHEAQGDLREWQKAAAFVMAGRVDMQVIVASAFAAPLVRLAGQKGLLVSAWSKDSGVGKTSALTVAQTVWGAPGVGMSLTDTHNSVSHKIGQTRNLPAFWDEMRVSGSEDDKARMVNFVFNLNQGKERARLTRDATLQPIHEWETLLCAAANAPLMDVVVANSQNTDAGAQRVFEFAITRPKMPQSSKASSTIKLATQHFGRAGHIYAAWLGTNHAKAEAMVELLTDQFITQTQAEQGERLHTAAMATLLAGAIVANRLGIVQFDIPALRTFLVQTFFSLRSARSNGNTLATGKGYDLQELLAQFWADNWRNRIVTDQLAWGRGSVNVVLVAQNPSSIDMQVGQSDKMMRIGKAKFMEFIGRKRLSTSDVLAEMSARWGATIARRTIGGGTPYGAGGAIWCIEIPLIAPELQSYLQGAPTPPAASTQTTRAAALQAPAPAAVAAMQNQPGATP
jgi:hypothetical protein